MLRRLFAEHLLCSLQILESQSDDASTLVKFYRAYVIPTVEYGAQVWSPCSRKLVTKLERFKKFSLEYCRTDAFRLFRFLCLTMLRDGGCSGSKTYYIVHYTEIYIIGHALAFRFKFLKGEKVVGDYKNRPYCIRSSNQCLLSSKLEAWITLSAWNTWHHMKSTIHSWFLPLEKGKTTKQSEYHHIYAHGQGTLIAKPPACCVVWSISTNTFMDNNLVIRSRQSHQSVQCSSIS